MSTEKIYFEQGDITITGARFVIGSKTFAMRNITSVQIVENESKAAIPGYLILIGIAMTGIGFAGSHKDIAFAGLVIAAAGVYSAWNQKSTFSVVLTTAAGEVSAYTSEKREFIATIVQALNRSIAERG